MLLWTIVFWMHLNSRGNLIVILLVAISTLLCEYTYLVTGNDLLKQVFGSYFKEWIFYQRLSMDILIKASINGKIINLLLIENKLFIFYRHCLL